MFLMVVIIKEFCDVKLMFFEEKENFFCEGYEVLDDIELGIMVEILVIVVFVDVFVKEVDFFSIGMNDLI